eukprot:m.190263 g.190263  ORF g.190263 m.190263 type:complete len:396 (+) comp39431_c0_seq12:173-1360(+)
MNWNRVALLVFLFEEIKTFCRCSDFLVPEIELKKMAFASCNMHDKPQPIWEKVAEEAPEIFVWLGDVVYGDHRVFPFVWHHSPLPAVKEKYQLQKQKPEYKNFLESGVRVFGVWDDHDYNYNDGDKDYPEKAAVKNFFLDFVDEPKNSVRWKRDGLYMSYLIGTGDKKVKLILLDVRSQFDRQNSNILGDNQWSWLEAELSNDEGAALIIVASGTQVLSDMRVIDSWSHNCPRDRERLLKMLIKTRKAVLLSGDVHFAEASCLNVTDERPLYELTSSGLTHNCMLSLLPEQTCSFFLNHVLGQSSRVSPQAYADRNFGSVTINWNAGKVVLAAHGINGQLFHLSFPLKEPANAGEFCPPPTQMISNGGHQNIYFAAGASIVVAVLVAVIVKWIRS